MSIHRYPCMAEPPTLMDGMVSDHIHACIHDAAPTNNFRPIEHECSCGMKWLDRGKPIDLSWVTVEHQRTGGIWSRLFPWLLP